MKVVLGVIRKEKPSSDAEKCATPNKGVAGRRNSVVSVCHKYNVTFSKEFHIFPFALYVS